MNMSYRSCSLDSVAVGECFQWGCRDGDIYMKIEVEKYRQLTEREKKNRVSLFDLTKADRTTTTYAALNLRTGRTDMDISGGNIQCVRLKGGFSVECHKPRGDT